VIWRNPWAWLGLAALALPVLIHLLGRGHARVQPFPSLRFLERSKLLPTRRARLHDIGLLAVRVGTLLAAVEALAQPFLGTRNLGRTSTTELARAILVDTSISMHRASNGGTALDVARRDAQRLASEAAPSLVVESSRPARELRGADAWLGRQTVRRELVVLSDFQTGSLTKADIGSVRPSTGIRLVRISTSTPTGVSEVIARSMSGATVAKTTAGVTSTDIQWSPRSDESYRNAVALVAAPSDRVAVDAAARAAGSIGVRLPLDTTHNVSIVFPSAVQRAELERRAGRLDEPWMTELVAQLRSDSLLIDAMRGATVSTSVDSIGLVVGRNVAGHPVVAAAKGDIDGRSRLILFSATDPGSLTSVALIAAVDRARSVAVPLTELEPAAIADDTLASWQREPTLEAPQPSSDSSDSDGRWLWILALALLGLETWMRRTRPPRLASVEMAHDRAA
jgi:Aerotolerance regulator N-terminal